MERTTIVTSPPDPSGTVYNLFVELAQLSSLVGALEAERDLLLRMNAERTCNIGSNQSAEDSDAPLMGTAGVNTGSEEGLEGAFAKIGFVLRPVKRDS